uniref:Uncharacterized protein n=1 Tax=Chromera velia CCMP2878 TaxID=1169474 RepID=A0A0G4I960_9ALVE|eukprot:Cvel_12178.t1-p1 / transcript=Cvel_12178.t1 / gene=Cvel_12178 / organism=Chromera_velia_CCMP2878 / gene_product=hypothetical protein / transcript_product=hypothetical protein / location=Cvel_scaffold786:47507-50179(-) / protein_length=555 / sequence_SO=supercontig / SO=protein_coding / is_pseudo=false
MTLYVYLTSPQERWGQLCALEQVHFGFRGHWDTVPVFSLTANEQNILAVVHRAVLERLGFAFVIPVEIVDGFLQAELADIGMGTGCVPSLLSVRMKIDLIGREFLSQLLRVDPTAPINAQSAAITRLVRPLYQRMRTWAVRHLGARAMPGGGGETVETQTGTTNATPLLPIPSSSKKPQAAPPSVPLMLQQAAEALQASSSSSFPNPFITNSGNPKPDKPASVRSAPGRVQRSKRSKSSGHNRHANPNANASVVEAAAAILAKHAAAAEEADEEEETDPAAPSAPPMQMLVPLPNTLGGGQQGAQWQEAQQNNHVGIRSQANAMGGTGVGGAFGAQQGQPGNAPNLVPQPQPLAHNGHQNENPTQNGSQLQPTAQPPQPTHPFQQHQMPPHIAPPGFYPNPLHPDNHNHPLPNPTPLPIPNYPVGNPNPLSNPEPLGGIPNLSLLQQLEHPADIFGVTPAAPQHPHPHHLNANGLNPLGVPEQILLGGHHTTGYSNHPRIPPSDPPGRCSPAPPRHCRPASTSTGVGASKPVSSSSPTCPPRSTHSHPRGHPRDS